MNNLILITETELRAVLTETIKTELANLRPTEPINDNQLITRLEASKILGISLPTLYKYTLESKIQSYRIGTRIRYKKEEILNSLSKIQSFKYH
jgi:excisionase family DNA binding protein